MFLIFGINDGNESLGARWCPYLTCHPNGAWMEITCTYQAFTLFFIPLFRISKRYFATCPYCGSVYEIPKEEWKRLSRDSSLPLNPDTLYIVPVSYTHLWEREISSGQFEGYTPNYTPVTTQSSQSLTGHITPAKIISAQSDYCTAVLL